MVFQCCTLICTANLGGGGRGRDSKEGVIVWEGRWSGHYGWLSVPEEEFQDFGDLKKDVMLSWLGGCRRDIWSVDQGLGMTSRIPHQAHGQRPAADCKAA
jgi:hypothetical protein